MSQENNSWNRSLPTYRKINTNDFCFFCLKATQIKTEESDDPGGTSSESESNQNKANPAISLRSLQRHLKINVNEKPANLTSEAASFKYEEVEVNLCRDCEKVVCKFSGLFQQLEKVQMEVDFYLGKIGISIKEGLENPEMVQTYSKGMTSKADTLSQLAWIDKLRKTIFKKCSKLRAAPHPIVEMNKVVVENNAIPSLVKEIVIEIKEDSNEKELSVPASPSHLNFVLNETENSSTPVEFLKDENTGRVRCPSCPLSFIDKQGAQTHYNVVHLNQKWKCPLCSIEIRAYLPSIRLHKKKCRERLEKRCEQVKAREHFKHLCAICNKRFPTKRGLSKHEWIVHESSRPYPCTLCGTGFKHACELKMHHKSVHLWIKWNCKYCNKQYSQPGARTMHEKICVKRSPVKVETEATPELNFSRDLNGRVPCPSCDEKFTEKYLARRHYNIVHRKKRKRDIPCDLCEKRYKLKKNLKDHKDSVHFNKTISCKYCKKQLKPRSRFGHDKKCEKRISGLKLDLKDQETGERVSTS